MKNFYSIKSGHGMHIKKTNNLTNSLRNRNVRYVTESEKKILQSQNVNVDSWEHFLVEDPFDPHCISNSSFFGENVIGSLQKIKHELANRYACGIYNSQFTNCLIGSNVYINSLLDCANTAIGSNTIIANIGEITTGDNPYFGQAYSCFEEESSINTIDIINENGGRAILPFEGMILSDAYLFGKYRNDLDLINSLKRITRSTCQSIKERLSEIGNFSIIKHCKSIQDTITGEYCIINGSESIYSCIIRSDKREQSKIGAGVQLRNCIVGFGSHIDSASQLRSVITGNNVKVEQCARISHTFIGDNSAISCCEISNNLLFGSHAQHHNNSFLIASSLGGQSNIAAGATIGSNHNSRVNDGEIWASRGFWPGLCTSFKHNSRFAAYTMLVKADYPSELDIPFPFSLVSNEKDLSALLIYPAYWFTNNMYALVRAGWKFKKRDSRKIIEQPIEHDPLAPDTIEQILNAMNLQEKIVEKEWSRRNNQPIDGLNNQGWELLNNNLKEIRSYDFEYSEAERGSRKVYVKNFTRSYTAYKEIVQYYIVKTILEFGFENTLSLLKNINPNDLNSTKEWVNFGGQPTLKKDICTIIDYIKSTPSINNWDNIHVLYRKAWNNYTKDKMIHVLYAITRIFNIKADQITETFLRDQVMNTIPICERLISLTKNSRTKDFDDRFKRMVYDSTSEMTSVLGNPEEDNVIVQFEKDIKILIARISETVNSIQ